MRKIVIFSLLTIFFTYMFFQLKTATTPIQTSTQTDQFLQAKLEQNNLEAQDNLLQATFAGGCFWCLEGPLESIEGVEGVLLGYMGGTVVDPTYQQVSSGTTGHKEVAQVYYDPAVTNYYDLVDIYWKFIDPTDAGGQFADRGSQYRIAIYYYTDEQKEIAQKYIAQQQASGKYDKPLVVEVLPAKEFYLAEDYHQNYYKKQSKNYKNYYSGSGREAYVESNQGE